MIGMCINFFVQVHPMLLLCWGINEMMTAWVTGQNTYGLRVYLESHSQCQEDDSTFVAKTCSYSASPGPLAIDVKNLKESMPIAYGVSSVAAVICAFWVAYVIWYTKTFRLSYCSVEYIVRWSNVRKTKSYRRFVYVLFAFATILGLTTLPMVATQGKDGKETDAEQRTRINTALSALFFGLVSVFTSLYALYSPNREVLDFDTTYVLGLPWNTSMFDLAEKAKENLDDAIIAAKLGDTTLLSKLGGMEDKQIAQLMQNIRVADNLEEFGLAKEEKRIELSVANEATTPCE